jgi:hypothetical protein
MIDIEPIKKLLRTSLKRPEYSKLVRNIKKVGESPNHNTRDERLMWEEQCYVNYPILYLGSLYLYLYALKRGLKLFLFATRDGCYWHKIFLKLFPDQKVCYFDCSRIMFDKCRRDEEAVGSQAYVEYVKSVMTLHNETPDTSVYVDIHGSGHRMFWFFEKFLGSVPDCFLLTARFISYDVAAEVCKKYHKEGKFLNVVFETGGGPIEMLNYDSIGTLQNYEFVGSSKRAQGVEIVDVDAEKMETAKPSEKVEVRAVRDRLEYPVSLIKVHRAAMDELIDKTRPIRPEKLKNISIENLDEIIKAIFELVDKNLPIIAKKFTHLSKHPEK